MGKRYPIGIQTFSSIIRNGYRYIDKTGQAFDLASKFKYVFLSRPRRFGKSLLTSTLHSYFSGEKELFEGLEAGRLEKEWTKYPVLHFDMSTAKHLEKEQLLSELNVKLSHYEDIYGKDVREQDCNQRLEGLIKRACAQTGREPVVRIGVNFDSQTRDISDWVIKED